MWQPASFGYTQLTTAKCSSGSVNPFVQIAVKAGVVYGLGEYGSVWANYSSCWSQVGAKSNFANSIATDNGSTTAVWASDGSGNIWVAE